MLSASKTTGTAKPNDTDEAGPAPTPTQIAAGAAQAGLPPVQVAQPDRFVSAPGQATVDSSGKVVTSTTATPTVAVTNAVNAYGAKVSPSTPVPPTSSAPTGGSSDAAPGVITGGVLSPTQQAAAQAGAEGTALTNLNSDLAAGQTYTANSGAFANGAMGRVGDTTSANTADALAKAQALEGGLSAPQMQAQKELNDQAIGGQLNSSLMQLRGIQGAQGLRGGSAAAQQVGLLNTAEQQQQTAARQEQLDQLAAQQAGVQNYLSDSSANNAVNTANTEYNNQQANAEAAGRLSTPLTYAGLLQGVRTGADANLTASEGASTAALASQNAAQIAAGQLIADTATAKAADVQAENDTPTS